MLQGAAAGLTVLQQVRRTGRASRDVGRVKQVTVLFADVVHSMDIAAAVGAERLREIMTELVERSAAVVQRYGGTLSQFTGDGIMAVTDSWPRTPTFAMPPSLVEWPDVLIVCPIGTSVAISALVRA